MYVFIDTNIFMKYGFNFENRTIENFKSYCIENKATILTTNLYYKEIQKKITDWISERYFQNNDWKKTRKLHRSQELKDEWKKLQQEIDSHKNSIVKDYYEQFTKFLSSIGSENIDNETQYTEQILEKYFNQTPPFSKSKDKEFPDAFMLLALDGFARQRISKIVIISDDNDFRNFCNQSFLLDHYPSIEEWTVNIDINKEYIEQIEEIIDSNIFYTKFNNVLENINPEKDDFELLHHGTIDQIDLLSFEPLPTVKTVEINQTGPTFDEVEADITFDIEIRVLFTITEPDRNTAFIMEEKTFFAHERTITFEQVFSLPISVLASFSEKDNILELQHLHLLNAHFEDTDYVDTDDFEQL